MPYKDRLKYQPRKPRTALVIIIIVIIIIIIIIIVVVVVVVVVVVIIIIIIIITSGMPALRAGPARCVGLGLYRDFTVTCMQT